MFVIELNLLSLCHLSLIIFLGGIITNKCPKVLVSTIGHLYNLALCKKISIFVLAN